MSKLVKSKFAGLFRGLFRRGDQGESEPAARPVTAATPAAPPAQNRKYAATTSASRTSQRSDTTDLDKINLPLAPIIAGLPMELRAKIMSVPPPDQTISLSVEEVTAQLAFGAVKITFGELRKLAAGVFSNSGGEQDDKVVNLPLSEILARVNPALLARRSAKKVEVAEDISGPFGGRESSVIFSPTPPKATPSAPKSASSGATFAPPSRMNQPAAATPPPAPSQPIAFAIPQGFDRPPAPAANGNGNGHHAPPPAAKISAAPASPSLVPRSEPAQPTVFVMVGQLMENWPDEVKTEISNSGLSNLKVPLAGADMEAGLKRGRVTMPWKQLRILAKPGSPESPNDHLELDLPLKVVAPLYFAAQKNGQRTQRNTTVSEEIPNLFFGFPQPAPAAPVAAVTPVAPEPTASPLKMAAKKQANSNYYAKADNVAVPADEDNLYASPPVPHTDFTSRHASPKEVVARAMALAGVAGVVVTLPDGLRVASEVPAAFNADTLAAFIPQLFERMNQSARELRMGALNNVSFTVGNVPWRIFRVNAVYLAAFGRAGESLPTAQLATLAGELDRKKQQ